MIYLEDSVYVQPLLNIQKWFTRWNGLKPLNPTTDGSYGSNTNLIKGSYQVP